MHYHSCLGKEVGEASEGEKIWSREIVVSWHRRAALLPNLGLTGLGAGE